MAKKKHLKVLFIGNSHTYYHDLPAWVSIMAREEGYDCDVTMLAHGGWSENLGGPSKRAGRRSRCTIRTGRMHPSGGSNTRRRSSG